MQSAYELVQRVLEHGYSVLRFSLYGSYCFLFSFASLLNAPIHLVTPERPFRPFSTDMGTFLFTQESITNLSRTYRLETSTQDSARLLGQPHACGTHIEQALYRSPHPLISNTTGRPIHVSPRRRRTLHAQTASPLPGPSLRSINRNPQYRPGATLHIRNGQLLLARRSASLGTPARTGSRCL